MKTAQEAAKNWRDRMATAGPAYKAGIERVTESPAEAAVRQQSLMLLKLTEAITSGKWANALRSISLSQWKEMASTKGSERLASGAREAGPKQEAIMGQIMANIDSVMAEVDRTPRGTFEENVQRAIKFMTGMHDRPIKK